jgi:hypothetical protein
LARRDLQRLGFVFINHPNLAGALISRMDRCGGEFAPGPGKIDRKIATGAQAFDRAIPPF